MSTFASCPDARLIRLRCADMRAKIADAYSQRVDKYEKYVAAFEVRFH